MKFIECDLKDDPIEKVYGQKSNVDMIYTVDPSTR